MIEQGTKLAGDVVESLKGQPLALALVVVNMLYIGGGIWFAKHNSAVSAQHDQLILQLARCPSIEADK